MLRNKILQYRERFMRLERKWHILIGSQLLFGMMVVRMHLHGEHTPQKLAERKTKRDQRRIEIENKRDHSS